MSSYRNVKRHERGAARSRKMRRGGSSGKFNDWKPPIDSPVWVRYFEGQYATCEKCNGRSCVVLKGGIHART
jgi:hypothetical protein